MTQYHSNNSTFFTEECQDDMYALKQGYYIQVCYISSKMDPY